MHKTIFRHVKYRGFVCNQREFEEICMNKRIIVEPSTVKGTYEPPKSKSWTHRAAVIALLADGTSNISNPLISDDTNTTLECIERLGARIMKDTEKEWHISGGRLKSGCILNARNSGTTLRMMMAISALIEGKTKLLGDSSLDTRPVADLADALQQLGANVDIYYSDKEKRRIIEVKGKITPGKVRIRKLYSSQALSSLILTLPLLKGESAIIVDNLLSKPYVKLTLELAKLAGAHIEFSEDYRMFRIPGYDKYKPPKIEIPIDFSSIAYPICTCLLSGEHLQIRNIRRGTFQADEYLLDFLPTIGADLKFSDYTLYVKGPSNLKEFAINLEDCPDLFPPLCILATKTNGLSKLYGASHLAYKESNRIEAMYNILNSIGIKTKKRNDGLEVFGNVDFNADFKNISDNIIYDDIYRKGKGKGEQLGEHLEEKLGCTQEKRQKNRVKVDACRDHRIAMSAFILGMCLQDGIEIENADCISVSYPKFLEDMRLLGAKYHLV